MTPLSSFHLLHSFVCHISSSLIISTDLSHWQQGFFLCVYLVPFLNQGYGYFPTSQRSPVCPGAVYKWHILSFYLEQCRINMWMTVDVFMMPTLELELDIGATASRYMEASLTRIMNSDWSSWPAFVVSCTFLMPVKIVDHNSNNHLTTSFPLQHFSPPYNPRSYHSERGKAYIETAQNEPGWTHMNLPAISQGKKLFNSMKTQEPQTGCLHRWVKCDEREVTSSSFCLHPTWWSPKSSYCNVCRASVGNMI